MIDYKDKNKSIDERADSLISIMTLEEKVAQLCCVMIKKREEFDKLKEEIKNGIGTISLLGSSLTGNIENDMAFLQDVQDFLQNETRLGIPALAHNEGICGAQIPAATTFIESLGLAASWEPELAEKIAGTVRKQLVAFGFKAVHSPLFDLGRDSRWGRIGETYGEDPYLVSQMGTAFVKGVQGDDEVMASAKHFIAYGASEGGRNAGEQQISERRLLDTYCIPFESAIHDGKIMAVMNSYGILNEEYIAGSKYILTNLLRDKLGFDGVVVADYGSISNLSARYRVAYDHKEAGIMALKAGLDVEQPSPVCYKYLTQAVRDGEIDESLIDKAVKRILKVKFRLGLIDNKQKNGDFLAETKKAKNKALALESAEKSMVLLKNENNILPIKTKIKIAVIGPSANSKENLFGGYSSVASAQNSTGDFDRSEMDAYLQKSYEGMLTVNKHHLKRMNINFEDKPSLEQKEQIMRIIKSTIVRNDKAYKTTEEFINMFYPDCKSVLSVLRERFGEDNIIYAKGCDINNYTEESIKEAEDAAKSADFVIAVLGGLESISNEKATCGENKDNINIDLQESQLKLMKRIFATGKDVVSVIIDGRSLSVTEITAKSRAVLYAWAPAEQGPNAIVNILTGKCNPGGKLPVTIVKEVGQLPMYMGRLPIFADIDDWADYVDRDKNTPLFHFGYGLSYTSFEYKDLKMPSAVSAGDSFEVSFNITNTGEYDGDEIIQLYIRDCFSSVSRPVKQLCGFKRVPLKKGESKRITFKLDSRQFAFHDINMNHVIEPGKMDISIGASSCDIRLKGSFEITGETIAVKRKVFSSQVTIS